MHGSGGALTRRLLDRDLVDEMNLFIFPAVVGAGTRLFPDTGSGATLELVELKGDPLWNHDQVYRTTRRRS